MSGLRRVRRGVWLCTVCKRCRRYTCLQTFTQRMWCAVCQAVTAWRLTQARPRMHRNLSLVWQGPHPEEEPP